MRIRLKLKASNLPNVAGLFKGTSDPYARVYHLEDTRLTNSNAVQHDNLHLARTDRGSTEVIKNNLNPEWTTTFNFDYKLGTLQMLEICIYDEIRKSDDKFMGSVQMEIGEILGSKGNVKAKSLSKGGFVIARLDEVHGSGSMRLQVSGGELNMKGSFRKQKSLEYFYQMSRKHLGHNGAQWCVVHRSKQLGNDSTLEWDETLIDLSVLCGNDLNRPILLEIFNYKRNGKHVVIGRSETTVPGIMDAARKLSKFTLFLDEQETGNISFPAVELLDADDDTQSSLSRRSYDAIPRYRGGPSVTIDAPQDGPIETEEEPSVFDAQDVLDPPKSEKATFFDYMKGGCEFSLKIAIDFTGSNGDPREPGSLHYLSPDGAQNDYEKAIQAIGEILLAYVPNKQVAV